MEISDFNPMSLASELFYVLILLQLLLLVTLLVKIEISLFQKLYSLSIYILIIYRKIEHSKNLINLFAP